MYLKKIFVSLVVLFSVACEKNSFKEAQPDAKSLIKSEKRTLFDGNSSKSTLAHYIYDDAGVVTSIQNDSSVIQFLIQKEYLGSMESPYVISTEVGQNSELVKKYFCDAEGRVLREEASEGTVRTFAYDGEGRLVREVLVKSSGEPDHVTDYNYDVTSENSSFFHDSIAKDFYVKLVDNTWNFVSKRYSHHYYTKENTSSIARIMYPFSFGIERDRLLHKSSVGPVIEGVIDEIYYTYSFDKSGNVIERKSLSNGKYTEIVNYTY